MAFRWRKGNRQEVILEILLCGSVWLMPFALKRPNTNHFYHRNANGKIVVFKTQEAAAAYSILNYLTHYDVVRYSKGDY